MGIYESRRIGKYIFLSLCGIAIIVFLIVSNNLVKQLARQERERMNTWAAATERMAQTDMEADFDFLLGIISQNHSIPVLVADSALNIIDYRNFPLPEKVEEEATPFYELSPRNREWLEDRLIKAVNDRDISTLPETDPHFIRVEVYYNTFQYIYFEDSLLLRRLSYYPYVQLGVMLVIAIIIYVALVYTKRAEQNRVWAGLSKETAHQLGTPISSLMAWNEYLASTGIDPEVTGEMNKDIKRLSVIADRFSKIGSVPELKPQPLNEAVEESLLYMRNRISGKVKLEVIPANPDPEVNISVPLFEWVMENLMKNAVDAMDGKGELTVTIGTEKNKAWIELRDTGKGIARKNFKNVFSPGFTTKKRGWGLGLTLVKRIIEEYHGGRIFVKESEIGKGTVFRIELPCVK